MHKPLLKRATVQPYCDKHTNTHTHTLIYKYAEEYGPSKTQHGGFPGDQLVKNPPSNAGNISSIPGWKEPTCLGAIKPMYDSY